jgi:hypothetical protein
MSYSDFKSLDQAVFAFDLSITEGKFLNSGSVPPTPLLQQVLERELDWAIAVGGEKARSEGIIAQILLDVREQQKRQISVFSGKEFEVDPNQGLTGYCDYVISLSPVQSVITAPVIIVAEAKKGDLELGLGQCVAGLVAAQIFNNTRGLPTEQVFGAVTSGSLWKFMRLQGQQLQIDVAEYSIPPVDTVLGILCAMVQTPIKVG